MKKKSFAAFLKTMLRQVFYYLFVISAYLSFYACEACVWLAEKVKT